MKHFILTIVMMTLVACTQQSNTSAEFVAETAKNMDHTVAVELMSLAKVYGYVRYFHPSDEALALNWEQFLVYSTAQIIQNQDQPLAQRLNQLFQPIAPGIQIYGVKETPPEPKSSEPKAGQQLKFWQHKGLGFESPAAYQSTRVGDIPDEVANYVLSMVAGEPQQNKYFRLTARAKVNSTDNGLGGRLFLATRNQRYQLEYQDLMTDRLIQNSDWQTYEISGQFGNATHYIALGAELVGPGQMWVDDFQLEVSADGQAWESVTIENSDFSDVGEDQQVKAWRTGSPEGFFAFNAVADQGNSVLHIKSIKDHSPGQLYDADLSEIRMIRKPIGHGLQLQLPLAVWDADEQSLNPSFQALQQGMSNIDMEQVSLTDVSVQLANVIKVWNVIQHFYPYFDVVDVDWSVALEYGIQQALSGQSENQHHQTLQYMLALMEDGHGILMYQPDPIEGALPIRVEWLEEQLVVTASEVAAIEKGDVIVAVDGIDAKTYLLQLESLVSGSPHLQRHRALNRFAVGDSGSEVTLQIKRGFQQLDLTQIRTETQANMFFNAVSEFDFPDIAELEPGIFYVNLFSTSAEAFAQHKPQLAEAKGIIFDNRWDGESSGQAINKIRDLLPHLTQTTVGSAQWGIPQISLPDREQMGYGYSDWEVEPAEPFFAGKHVMINVPSVVSAGETFMGMLDHYDLVTTVGEATAGCNGNVNYIELIGGARAWFTGMRVLKHDNSQLHLIGYEPDYPVQKSIEALVTGRDEYLEQALAVVRNSNK